jgi:hypothetical protein
MFGLTPRASSRRITIVAALIATFALVGCMPATASNVKVHNTLFGMHDGTFDSSSYAHLHEGAVRLWDTGTQWQDIERHSGGHKYDWATLDALVARAKAAHAEITMVIGGTPRFYASTPTNPPHKLARYADFVRALMTRYHNRIDAYEVWNESNIATFWTGSAGQMARMTKIVHDLRDKLAKKSAVVAPSMVTRLKYQLTALSQYYHQRVSGKPVWRYFDDVALSLYPLPKYGRRIGVPEDSMAQLRKVRGLLHKAGVPGSKPIWNTEVNYGLQSGSQGGTAAARISEGRQAANVMRTYLLNAANGIKRVFWYRYDMSRLPGGGSLSNTMLTSLDNPGVVTAAGRAYARARAWMHGTLLGSRKARPCAKDRHGTYTCVVKDSTGTRRIYWNPFHTGRVKLASNAHHLTGVLGGRTKVRPHQTIKVGYKPVMVGR